MYNIVFLYCIMLVFSSTSTEKKCTLSEVYLVSHAAFTSFRNNVSILMSLDYIPPQVNFLQQY